MKILTELEEYVPLDMQVILKGNLSMSLQNSRIHIVGYI